MDLPVKVIKDEYGNIYTLDSVLGQGGQGMVCRTKDKNIAIKLVMKNDEILKEPKSYDVFRDRINDIIVMNIDNDINLCRPYAMLEKPICGYVMHMLKDLMPINSLMYIPDSDEKFNDFFLNTGGLKKRIEVLIELSRTLARLHSKGIVYCDISPKNVFYSSVDTFSKVWIIDCDNLKYSGEIKNCVFTPGYGAPEVVANITSNTIFSDCFSFAVLAFRILTFRNPFEVDYSSSSSSDGWDASTTSCYSEDAISSNNIPWLFENGVTDELRKYFNHFLTKEMLNLFERTFGRNGRLNPTTRPSMREWYSVLKETYPKIKKCQCGSYIFAGEELCPFCHSKTPIKYYGSLLNIFPQHKEMIKEIKKEMDEVSLNDVDFINDIIDKKTKPSFDKVYNFVIYENCRIYNFNINQLSIFEAPYPIIEFKISRGYLYIVNKHFNSIRYYFNGETGIISSGNQYILKEKETIYLYVIDPNSKITHCLKINSL